MDIFAPGNLPGTGMGDLESLGGICGLIGLAVTSGALLIEGVIGTLLYLAAALAVLGVKDDAFGDRPELVGGALAAIVVLSLVRRFAGTRAAVLGGIAALAGGAAVGFAWAEWNEVPFGFDSESAVGVAIGVAAAAVGARAAYLFLTGSVQAGGHAGIVGAVVAVVALACNAIAFYVPFAGIVVFALALVLVLRLRRRDRKKYKGLRKLT
jgi:hypothetical protein